MRTKADLTIEGIKLCEEFCKRNKLLSPEVVLAPEKDWRFGVCAYYRQDKIHLHVPSCAHIGRGGACWSYPGYTVDRTPYGVIQHELGHHVDYARGQERRKYFSEFSSFVRRASGEEKLTNYCPNDAEWFAEMMRLFITNSDLLYTVRPRTYDLLRSQFEPVVTAPWQEVLADAPERTTDQVWKRIARAEKFSLGSEPIS